MTAPSTTSSPVGINGRKYSKDASDFQKYLQLLTICKNRYKHRLYAYVLMNNHVHLLIETGDIELSKILRGINQSYTFYALYDKIHRADILSHAYHLVRANKGSAGIDGWLDEGACLMVKNIGKPCAGKPHARFDEGGLAKAAMVRLLRHRQTKVTETDRPSLQQQPALYSTCTPSSFSHSALIQQLHLFYP